MKIAATATVAYKSGLALASFLGAFYTCSDLMSFLSNPNIQGKGNETHDEDASEIRYLLPILVNVSLLSMFILQHSLLALQEVKDFFEKYEIKDIQRCIYVISTCFSLELLMKNWQYTKSCSLWEFTLDNHSIYWLYMLAHGFSWLLIYIGSICMDINELLGIKQVYYSLQQLPEPLSYKSAELRKLYAHMRHPSFLGFIIIFWFVPVLRLDRILLATLLTSYMYVAWTTDSHDLAYQKSQFGKKIHLK